MTKSKLCAVLVVGCIVSACSAVQGDPASDAGDGPSAGAAASPAAGSGGAGVGARGGEGGSGGSSVGVGDYRVRIEASRLRVCAGECVELSASAQGGHAPHRYTWSDGISEGAGPHRACPEETTTYSVTARDTATLGEEFGEPSQEASASLEITVDGDASCDLEPDSGMTDPRGTTELCRASIELGEGGMVFGHAGWRSNSTLATDREGNAYFGASLEGTLHLGAHTIAAPAGQSAGVVLKYDASCELVWARVLAAESSAVFINAVAAGGDGELAVGGLMTGVADFGGGLIGSSTTTEALLVKLSADDGRVLWNASFGGLFSADAIADLGMDDAGNITLSGNAGADTSFGGAPIGGAEATVSYVAQLTSTGAHRFSVAIADDQGSEPIAVNGSGDVAFAGRSDSDGFAIGLRSFALEDPTATNYVAMFDGAGEVSWVYMHHRGDEADSGEWTGGVAIDRERNTVLDWLVVRVDSDGNAQLLNNLVKLGPDGSLLWNRPAQHGRLRDAFSPGGLAVDSELAIVHLYADPPVEVDGGVMDGLVHVEKLSAEGEPTWEHGVRRGSLDGLSGIAVGPDDEIWVAHGERRGFQSAFAITKLAP